MGKSKAGAGAAPVEEEPSAVIDPAPGEVTDAVNRLGEAVVEKDRAEHAGLDLTEEGHRTAIERMEDNARSARVDSKTLIADVRDALLQAIKDRPKPWSATSNGEQRDVAAACEAVAEELVRKVVEQIAVDPAKKPIRCLLVGYADKGDDVKIDLKLKVPDPADTTAAIVGLHEAKGKHVMLTVASAGDYRGEDRAAQLDDDEPPLDFEAGLAPPDDDSDLAQAGGDESELVTGIGRANLDTGMWQSLTEGGNPNDDADWEDVRQLTDEEIEQAEEAAASE